METFLDDTRDKDYHPHVFLVYSILLLELQQSVHLGVKSFKTIGFIILSVSQIIPSFLIGSFFITQLPSHFSTSPFDTLSNKKRHLFSILSIIIIMFTIDSKYKMCKTRKITCLQDMDYIDGTLLKDLLLLSNCLQ